MARSHVHLVSTLDLALSVAIGVRNLNMGELVQQDFLDEPEH